MKFIYQIFSPEGSSPSSYTQGQYIELLTGVGGHFKWQISSRKDTSKQTKAAYFQPDSPAREPDMPALEPEDFSAPCTQDACKRAVGIDLGLANKFR